MKPCSLIWPPLWGLPRNNPNKNIPQIPAESRWNSGPDLLRLARICLEFQVDSRWNLLESTGIIAGIYLVFCQNSRLLWLEFCWNYCQHFPGILPDSTWNSNRTWNTSGILPEFQVYFLLGVKVCRLVQLLVLKSKQ